MYNISMKKSFPFAKRLGVVVCVLFLSVGLASCGNQSAEKASEPDLLPSLKVQKNGDAKPSVEYSENATINVEVLDAQNGIGKNVVKVLDEGDGDEIQDGQDVSIGYVYYTMPGFEEQTSSWDESGSFEVYTMQSNDSEPNSLYNTLSGLKVGAVLGVATPGFSSDGSGLDLTGANYSVQVLVVESAKFPNTRATGKDVPKSELKPGFPKVTLADDGTPSIEVPKGFAFGSGVEFEQLKIGDGPEIDDTTVASYAYVAFRPDGTKIQSTWEEKFPLTTAFNSLNEAWKSALEGAQVGDQYLIIAPSSEGAGVNPDDAQDIIYVVDVLDVR